MTDANEPYLLVIRSGPMWKLEAQLGHLAEAFGSSFEGEILTWATSPGELSKGRFRVRRYALPYEKPLWARLRYVTKLVKRALYLRWRKNRRLVVIAYDPFESGLIGLLIKWLTGAAFVCEVNGVYGDPATLVDMDDPDRAARRRRRMLRVGSFVLRRSDAIKLLYPGQLVGFSVPEDHPPRYSFHDLVNGPRFEPKGLEREKTILLVGYPYLLKGVDILLRAFSRLAEDFPDWRLELVGFQLEERAIEEAADVAYPTNRVSFPGPIPPDDVATAMEKASIFVLPSRSEGMGRVLLEAAFTGCPRIASTAGGIPHVVDHDSDGLLVEPGSVEDLERALRRLMTDSALRARLGRAARTRALEEFTIEEFMRHYRELVAAIA